MVTRFTRRVVILVPAADRAAAGAAAKRVDAAGGERAFSVPLVRAAEGDGAAPRAYLCNWQMTPAERRALADAFQAAGLAGRARFFDVERYEAEHARQGVELALAAEGLRERG